MATKTKKTKTTGKSKLPEVIRNIQPVGEVAEHHVALAYGKAGTGKTHFASTFPRPILVVDIDDEKGTKTIKEEDDIDIAKVKSQEDIEELYYWLKEGTKYKTIVLDQITGLQNIFVQDVRDRRNLKKHDLLTRKNWGEISGNMKTWLSHYRGLGDEYNVVFLAHERAFGGEEEADDNQIDPNVGARVMPSVGSFVDGACDFIGQTFIRAFTEKVKTPKGLKKERRTQYCMRVGPHPTYNTKIRRPASAGPLPAYVVNPTYRKLVALEDGEDVK